MKKRDIRIPKDAHRMLRDLVHHVANLRGAMARQEAGDAAAYKDVLFNLRTLIGKKRSGRYDGLLFHIAEIYQYGLGTHVRKLRPDLRTNQIEEHFEEISLEDYLDRPSVNAGVTFTDGDFVWEYASQDAAHTDTGLSIQYAAGENTFYRDLDLNRFYAMRIARTVEPIATALIPLIEKKMANQPTQRNAGSRPPSDDSPDPKLRPRSTRVADQT